MVLSISTSTDGSSKSLSQPLSTTLVPAGVPPRHRLDLQCETGCQCQQRPRAATIGLLPRDVEGHGEADSDWGRCEFNQTPY